MKSKQTEKAMKNRERLMSMALVDLLDRINKEMPCYCVIQALGEEDGPDTCDNKCYDCIAAYLNEEVNNG